MRRTCWLALGLLTFACGGRVETDGSGGSGGTSGGSGGASGGTAGTTGGAGGAAGCAALKAAYGSALAQAKQCSPFVNSLQCTAKISSPVTCGCPTFVNPGNLDALQLMKELEGQWSNAGCSQPCPASCPAPHGSACEQGGAGGDTGTCQDQY